MLPLAITMCQLTVPKWYCYGTGDNKCTAFWLVCIFTRQYFDEPFTQRTTQKECTTVKK